MNEYLIAAGILLVLIIITAMWKIAFRERDPHGIDAYAAEVTSSNSAAILAQIAGTPLNEVLFDRCEQEAALYPRVRSARMREILISAGSLDREELTQAAIRLGNNREIAEAYADEIRELAGDDVKTPPMPNMGDGDVPYAGPNYSEPFEIAREMKGIRQYHGGE